MKGKLLVVFHSVHGYVKRYVDIIGNALGCDAVPADKLRADMLGGYDKILYIGSLRGETIGGIKKFSEYFEGIYKKLVICGVGLTPFRNYMPQRLKETSVSIAYEKFIPVFYAQGGFDVDELSRTEKFTVAWRVRQIKIANVINDDDTFFMNAVNKPIDEVKLENIQPLIDYLEGKPVDEKLYSPPEITDPEEQKKFFDELEKASKAPENKKRAIKKKIKGGLFSREPSDVQSSDGQPQDEESGAETEEKPQQPSELEQNGEADTAAPSEAGDTSETEVKSE